MNQLRIAWEMYGVPVLMFGGIVILLVVQNFFVERTLKSRPDLRHRVYRMYVCISAVECAVFATAIAVLVGEIRVVHGFPFFLGIALAGAWKKLQTEA